MTQNNIKILKLNYLTKKILQTKFMVVLVNCEEH